MSDAIKFKNNKYLDTSGSVHNGMVLKTWLQNFYNQMHSSSAPYLFRDTWWTSGSGQSLNNVANGINFAYSNHGNPSNGTAVTFSGTTNSYQLQLASDYLSSRMYMRTQNGDNGTWNPWATIANTSDIPSVSNLAPLNRTVVTLWSGSVQSGSFSVSNMSRYRMLAILPGTSSGSYATWIIIPCTSDSSALRGIGAYNTSNVEIYTTSGTRSASSITMTEIGRTTFYNNQYPKYSRLYFKKIVGIY